LFLVKNSNVSFGLDLALVDDIHFSYYQKDLCDEIYFYKLNKYLNLFESETFIN
jgi:hypothetical protein